MTLDTIHSLIVTVTWVPIVIVFTSYIARLNKRLDRQEAEIRQLWNRITPLEIALAQARTLDNHTDRLSVLEGEQ